MRFLMQDLRYGIRTLANNPGSAAVAILVLSLGIGANSAIFSVTNAALLRPLPYREPDRVVFLWGSKPAKAIRQERISALDFQDFRGGSQTLEEMGAIQPRSSVLIEKGVAERIDAAAVSPSAFDLLGMRPALGRSFEPDEDQPGKNRVAILSGGLWQRRFGGDRSILGEEITLDGRQYRIVGVAPAQFHLPAVASEIWIPYTPAPKDLLPDSRGYRELDVVGRLKSGGSLERAQSELRIIAAHIADASPDSNAGYSIDLVGLRDQLSGGIRPTILLLSAAVLLVLLIACVNLAHLLLARAAAREKEIAVRAALGASSGRLIRQLLTESVVLALAAGLLGLLFAYWGAWIISKFAPAQMAQTGNVTIDWRVLAFTLVISSITGVGFGLAPALVSARSNLNGILRSGGRGGASTRNRSRLRDVLLVCEIAWSVALLVGAGLLIRSFIKLENVNPGFRTDHVLSMQLSLPQTTYPGMKVGLFFEQLLREVHDIPGVQTAGICRFLPLSGSDASANFQIEGLPAQAPADQPRAKFRTASDGYFQALGIPLIRGRLFDGRDKADSPKVVIINETAARRYWPNDNPVGKRILFGQEPAQWSTVIGVVGDVKHTGLDVPANPETYYHYLQIAPDEMNFAESTMALAIRTNANPDAMIASVRQVLHNLDSSQPLYNVRSMDEVVQKSIAAPRFRMFLVGVFAGLAFLLVSLGLYGVVAYSVSQRTTEFGIRVALGAEPADILKRVLLRAVALAAIGLAIGCTISVAANRILARFLFDVPPTDPVVFGAASLVILALATVASLGPALRAAKIDPAIALRSE